MSIHKDRLTRFIERITSGKEKVLEPRNFMTKKSKTGTPNPKL